MLLAAHTHNPNPNAKSKPRSSRCFRFLLLTVTFHWLQRGQWLHRMSYDHDENDGGDGGDGDDGDDE